MNITPQLVDARRHDDLDTDPLRLLADFADWAGRTHTARITLKGPVPRGSSMGVIVRMGWVSYAGDCGSECWALCCPDPENHKRVFSMTEEGMKAARRLGRA